MPLQFLCLGLALGAFGCTRSNGLAIDDDGGCGLDCVDLAVGDGGSAGDLRRRDGGPVVDLAKPPPPADLSGISCVPSCNHCQTGVCCPGGVNACCGPGEWCDSSGQCRCGQATACTKGDVCSSGGPIGGPGMCGSICCGASGPCPL
jgi:hypothetical protein